MVPPVIIIIGSAFVTGNPNPLQTRSEYAIFWSDIQARFIIVNVKSLCNKVVAAVKYILPIRQGNQVAGGCYGERIISGCFSIRDPVAANLRLICLYDKVTD